MQTTKGESIDAHAGGGSSCSSDEAFVMKVERRGCLGSTKADANRETGRSMGFARRLVPERWQEDGWDEPCKSRGLRTVLWAAGGAIPLADPASQPGGGPVRQRGRAFIRIATSMPLRATRYRAPPHGFHARGRVLVLMYG